MQASATASGSGTGRVEATTSAINRAATGSLVYSNAYAFGRSEVVSRADSAGAGQHDVRSESFASAGPVRSAIADLQPVGDVSLKASTAALIGSSLGTDFSRPADASFAHVAAAPDPGEGAAWVAEEPMRGFAIDPTTHLLAIGESQVLAGEDLGDFGAIEIALVFSTAEIAGQGLWLAFSEGTFQSLQETGGVLAGSFADTDFELSVSPDGTPSLGEPLVRLPTGLATGDLTALDLWLYSAAQPLTTNLAVRFAIFSTVPEPGFTVLCVATCAALLAGARLAGRNRCFARSTSPLRSQQHSRV